MIGDLVETITWTIAAGFVMGFWILILRCFMEFGPEIFVVGCVAGAVTLYFGAWCCSGSDEDD